ncbi:tetratricopeptide repeat protein [Oceanirhabdus seepicola]|uniref:Tetratricopeptide repeat protein n=1 Tax=Oceanirhabdus seepicola TaxID=2828781 RepID=A0A9J6NZ61_9CLOT|nr:hypothetical protein [Oceanirhabdus seepicola]MCM1989579.1 hypothetical protein [Oceanirhabdus seepicola]
MKNKRKIIIGIIIGLLIIGIPTSVYGYNSYNYNLYYSKAQNDIESEEYDEAILNFNEAIKYRKNNSEEINEQIKLIHDLKVSKVIYEDGLSKFKEKKYLESISIFEKIKEEDEKRYKLSQEKIYECKKLYININLDKAMKLSSIDKKYLEGLDYVDLALKVNPEHEQALKLKAELEMLYKDQHIYLAKKEAESKNYEEAIKHLDIILEFDDKYERAIELKPEYEEAIEKEKAAAKAKEEAQAKQAAQKNKVTSEKDTSSKESSGVNYQEMLDKALGRETLSIPPYKDIYPVHGHEAIKQELKNLGFSFDSNETAMFEQGKIKIGIVKSGDSWQLATKRWGRNEETVFWRVMSIIWGREIADSNRIYIDYALSMPGSSHKSPYIIAFIAENALRVRVFTTKQ